MVTQQKSKPTNTPQTLTSPHQIPVNPPIKPVAKKFKRVSTLRRRLLVSLLPTVLVPLAIASFIGNVIIERKAKAQIIETLEIDNFLASKFVANFLQDSFQTIDIVAANSEVMAAMKAASELAEEQQLTQKPIEELEKQFSETKLLTTDEKLNNYLKKIVQYTSVAEIFFTERNGLNIAHSGGTNADFVQRDDDWWQNSLEGRREISGLVYDDLVQANVIELSVAVKDPRTGEFLGVIKSSVSVNSFNAEFNNLYGEIAQNFQFQIINSSDGFLLTNVDPTANAEDGSPGSQLMTIEGIEIVGGEPIKQAANILTQVVDNSLSLEEAQQSLAQQSGFSEISLNVIQDQIFSETVITALFGYQDRLYSLSTVPKTNLVSIGSIDYGIIESAGNEVSAIFLSTAIVLGIFSLLIIILLARQITKPLTNLSVTTQKVTSGDLDIQVDLEGTLETRILADNFNDLVKQVKESLQTQTVLANEQQALADEKRKEKEELETAIYILIDEISDATEGDLTVRASLESLELSTVADLFNAIVSSLRDIAVETKQSARQVGSSLRKNEAAIRLLADQAAGESRETHKTLVCVEKMSQSIQVVAENASQAEKIADDTYDTVLYSTSDMDLTVDSILTLRATVGETAKKMKRLAESSQKISQAVSFIEEIALKTNILAINATVEAGRAGEYGEGFTIVAEQVGALAEQSAAATKEIANIVSTIQSATLEVSQAMESGTAQV
ncbi:methyl-accepting chemotaxis protein, partial [Hyella patelloides]|uniref:methyl-accepting chemotaxis protein n=1 Tax=Hyella patelloides TaxID=1982969 RepID=UPI0011A766F2